MEHVTVRWPVAHLLVTLVLLLGACGGAEMSMTEYGDRIDVIAREASERGEAVFAELAGTPDMTPQQLQVGIQRVLREIRIPLQEAVDGIDPPASIADLHELMWNWHAEFIATEEALAVRVGDAEDSVEGWTALSDSPEMAAYRTALAEGKEICDSFQARLDATAEAGALSDTPWIPSDMKEIVEAALGCQWFPENADDVYRFPPSE